MKTVYTCFCTDIIHEGHKNIIAKARELGRVVVGALSDEALIRYNRFPTATLEERMATYAQLDGVDEVVVQEDMLYDEILERLRPDFVIHGDNWREGPESAIRANVLSVLEKLGGGVLNRSPLHGERRGEAGGQNFKGKAFHARIPPPPFKTARKALPHRENVGGT